jgi:hypothetical protein
MARLYTWAVEFVAGEEGAATLVEVVSENYQDAVRNARAELRGRFIPNVDALVVTSVVRVGRI